MNNGEKDPIQELWEHRNDPEEWSEEAVDIEARPTGSTVVSFRLPWEEYEALEEAATARGESLSEFIRKALRIRLEGIVIAAFVDMTYGGGRELRLRTDTPAGFRGTEASYDPSLDPDQETAVTTP
jgi:hypothetical protein